MNPAITILLPAYNCENYLSQTIDSLIAQTFTDFELLIINDGSTDNTTNIINSYKDQKIRHIKNDGNKGLIYSLNTGIKLANGKYIARMDADDICKPDRLQQQYQWLENNTKTDIVACCVEFINEKNIVTGDWPLDKQAISATEIKKAMAWQNCIAHPSVMMRASVIKAYQYANNQKHSEDYDLWLQVLADGKIIDKIASPLLLYRVHTQSVTGSIHRKKNPFFTNLKTKKTFLLNRLSQKKWGLFESKICITMFIDGFMGIGKQVKSFIKK